MRTLNVYVWGGLCVLLYQTPGAATSETARATQLHKVSSATADNMRRTQIQRLSTKPRWKDYLQAKQNAYTWLDQLQVDPIELIQHGIKGKKKLTEILDAYVVAYRYATDQAEQARMRQRIIQLAQHTYRPEYHNMLTNSDTEFKQNRMSYLRALWLLEYMGLDTANYRHHLRAMQPRLDATLHKLGPWIQVVFGTYYDAFGLEKPPTLPEAPLQRGIIAQRLPLQHYDRIVTYHLIHEIFAIFEYGFRQTQNVFTPTDRDYLRDVLPDLIQRVLHEHNADLLAELLSCMTYLEWQSAPMYRQGFTYLLDHQNPTGTWGSNYESRRKRYGKYLDQNLYLHTTLVALRALIEAYEGEWETVD
jgi:hypothetical protein